MKKMFLIAAGVLLSAASFAQLSLGVQLAGNAGTATMKFEESPKWDKKALFGPFAGVVIQYGINNHFAIHTGANYLQHAVEVSTIGFDPDNGELGEIKMEAKNKFNYLQVPLYALYKKGLGGLEFYAGAGPFMNYGLSGKSKLTAYYTLPNGEEEQQSSEVDAFKKDDEDGGNFKRFDFGAGALAGLRLPGGLFVNVGYQLGLANITADEGNTYKTHGVQLTLGYFFK